MNSVCVIYSVLDTFTPSILLSPSELCINQLKASTTNMNTKGERGHPFLMPLVARKNIEGDPLISTAKEVDWIHPITQSTISKAIPIWINNSFTKV